LALKRGTRAQFNHDRKVSRDGGGLRQDTDNELFSGSLLEKIISQRIQYLKVSDADGTRYFDEGNPEVLQR
jgi:hypothetical protein